MEGAHGGEGERDGRGVRGGGGIGTAGKGVAGEGLVGMHRSAKALRTGRRAEGRRQSRRLRRGGEGGSES